MTRTLKWSFAMYITKHRNSCQMLITARRPSWCRFIPLLQHSHCKKMQYWTTKENEYSEYNRSTTDVVLLCCCAVWRTPQLKSHTAIQKKMMPHGSSLRETRAIGYVEADVCRWLTEGGDVWCGYLQKVKPQGTPDPPPEQWKQESN